MGFRVILGMLLEFTLAEIPAEPEMLLRGVALEMMKQSCSVYSMLAWSLLVELPIICKNSPFHDAELLSIMTLCGQELDQF